MRRLAIGTTVALGMIGWTGGAATLMAGEASWPGLRGPSWDGAVRDARLIRGEGQPALKTVWKQPIGAGYAAIAAGDGRVITSFASGADDVTAAFDAATGREIWRHRIDATYPAHDGAHGGPLSSPLLHAGRVYQLGPRGQLFALDAATGVVAWARDLVAEHGATKPFYGFTTSPLVSDGVLIVQMGAGAGKAIAGFDPATGKLLWTAGDDGVEYQSPIQATIDGVVQVLAATSKSLYGLEARSGRILWSHPHGGEADAMSGASIVPVPAGPGRFLIKTKTDLSVMLHVARGADQAWSVKELWSGNAIRGNYAIPVYHDGYLYGMTGRALTCVDAATGETKWRSREPGDGFPTLVGNHLVFITRPGSLHIVAASPRAYGELTRLALFSEHAWSNVSYADGHLFARSMGHLARIDVVAAATGATAASAGAGPAWLNETAFGRFLADARRAPDRKGIVDAWMARQKSFPVVEGDGIVHFVYRGKGEDVGIMGDLLGWDREDPMTRLEGTDLFHYSARVEPDAALTYGYIVDYGKPVPDPRNPRAASGNFGDLSVLTMPRWSEPASADEAPAGQRGRIETVDWESAVLKGAKRSAQVYLPAPYDADATRRFPVLYVSNGKNALEKAGAKNVLDRLLASGTPPAIVVFIAPGDGDPGWDPGKMEPYAGMLATELVPKIDGQFRTKADGAARASAGATTAANAAFYAAIKHPATFSRAGLLAPVVLGAKEYEALLQPASATPLVIYHRWGTYDLRSPYEAWDTVKGNRELSALLTSRGYQPTGGESHEGSGWTIWRGRLGEMLGAFFKQTP